jgi:solute carrier family 34 (sodium-dependent phosphate cotransporter)
MHIGRPTGPIHIGDVDFGPEDPAFSHEATWREVFHICCYHSPVEWVVIIVQICLACFFLYFFFVGLDLLGSGATVMGGCATGTLFGNESNPVAGLMIGILSTAFVQSSSTTISVVVSLVGAGSVSVQQGIYMVMGCNIGTSVTNTIVALGQIGDAGQLERAFAGATVNDMFNFMTVALLFPIEIITGYLYYLTRACVKNFETQDGEHWQGPLKEVVAPLSSKIIIANKDVIASVAEGGSCAQFYPTICDDPEEPTYSTCTQGLIGCDKSSDKCPAFFEANASEGDDKLSGFCALLLGLVILFTCLFSMVKVLQKMLLGVSIRIIHKATDINGYLAIVIGCAITSLIQSSSVTTSTLTPLVGLGVIRLEQMYPLTLGANLGTTITAILAGFSSNAEGMQVALAHLFFNVSGIIVWYPIPFLRRVPLHAARQLGRATRVWRGFPIVYIFVMFFLVELVILGLTALFTNGATGLLVLGSMITFVLFALLLRGIYWWRWQEGKDSCYYCLINRRRRHEAIRDLPDDMEFLKNKLRELQEHTGIIDEEDDNQDAGDDDPKERIEGHATDAPSEASV